MTTHGETIAALATARGYGGVGIIRVSGSAVPLVAQQLLHHLPPPRYAHYGAFYAADGESIDQGIALYFPAPHSFTGEAVLELQGHGGPVVLDRILAAVLAVEGVRPARAGEFSERAFLNGKLDLVQAEAVADLIAATSTQAARSALRSLQGEFSTAIHQLVEQLTQLRLFIEAAIDFADEALDLIHQGDIAARIDQLRQQFAVILRSATQGRLLREGIKVVIAGQPNAGKSSLLNRLAGEERAIVTDIAGTTRDLVQQEIQMDGMPLHIIDTAGLRESSDRVEQEGIRRTWQAIGEAEQVLLLIDATLGFTAADAAILAQLPPTVATTLLFNKIDQLPPAPLPTPPADYPTLYLSARTGAGFDQLRTHLKAVVGFQGDSEGLFMARRRHLIALEEAATAVANSQHHLQQGAAELVAEELRLAQQALGTITGEVTAEDLLGAIFSHFCIGK